MDNNKNQSAFARAKAAREAEQFEMEKTKIQEVALRRVRGESDDTTVYAKTLGKSVEAQKNLANNRKSTGSPLPPKKRKKKPLTPEQIAKRKAAAKKVGKVSFKVTKHTVGLIFSTILSIFMIGIITLTICCTALTVWVVQFMEEADEITIAQYEQKYDTVMYVNNPDYNPDLLPSDTNPEHLVVYAVKNKTMRIPITIDQIPQQVRNAFVCVEDERFYQHDGVDYKRTFAAFLNTFLHFYATEQGGSSITQQLIRTITKDDDVSVQRKMREIFRSMKFEKTYSKDEILEAYVNSIEFGNGAIGIEYAAQKYFGKSTWELSIAEAACLSGIPQSPEVNNPFSNLDINRTRMEYVLSRMYENGAISYDEYQGALAEHLVFTNTDEYKAAHPQIDNPALDGQTVTPWYVDAAIYELRDYFMETENMNQEEALTHINSGGYKIYLSIDLKMQEYLEEKYSNWDFFGANANDKNAETGELMQSAFIAMDYNGGVLATVGGVGNKEEYGSLCFNRATQATRDPGSTIKPVTSYGAAFLNDTVHFSSHFDDTKINVPGHGMWPNNYGGSVSGSTNNNLYYCLQRSFNTTPAQLIHRLSTQTVYDFATQRMGLDLNPNDNAYAPLTIGSMTNGLTLENLVNAYIPYGNGGTYYKAHLINKVNEGNGEVLFSNIGKGGIEAMDPDTAYVMNRMLHMVVNGGTGANAKLNNKDVVGKTGTSDNLYDLLFVGLTEDFVSGVWFGYDHKEKLKAINSPTIWKRIIGDWAENYNTGREYPKNDSVKVAQFCTVSGDIAGSGCPKSSVYGYYKPSYAPVCNGSHVDETDPWADLPPGYRPHVDD